MQPGLRFGRYEIGERLGKGGFGVVHLARDTELGRDLAIKFLKPEFLTREQIVQRFLQEARATAKIGHYFNQLGKESYAQICMKEGYDPSK